MPYLGVCLFPSLGFWGVGSSLLAWCHWCLLPCSPFVWECLVFSGTSASFGSPVPFTTWSPFGMSQGLLVTLSHSGLRVLFPWWSPLWSCLRFNYSSDSFASSVPLATWSPFGMSLAFLGTLSRSGLRFPYWRGAPFRPHSVRVALMSNSLVSFCG